jgi:hypothetical protein
MKREHRSMAEVVELRQQMNFQNILTRADPRLPQFLAFRVSVPLPGSGSTTPPVKWLDVEGCETFGLLIDVLLIL